MSEVYEIYKPHKEWDNGFNSDYPWQLNTAYRHFKNPKHIEALANNYNAILKHIDNCAWLRFQTEQEGLKVRDDMKHFYEVIVPALARAYMTNNEVKSAIKEITEPFTMMDEMSK